MNHFRGSTDLMFFGGFKPTDESLTNWWITFLLFEPYAQICCGSDNWRPIFAGLDPLDPVPASIRMVSLRSGLMPMCQPLTSGSQKKCIMFYLVAGLEHEFYDFEFSWECHHPNWRTHIFFRMVGQPPSRSCYRSASSDIVQGALASTELFIQRSSAVEKFGDKKLWLVIKWPWT